MELESRTAQDRILSPRSRGLLLLALSSTAAFLVLSVLVATGVTQELDDSARQLFRPDDVWGANQLLVGNVVDGLAPPVALALLALAGTVAAGRARSLRPLGYVVLLTAVAVVLTIASKTVLHRPDPHGGMTSIGGAFPSGHMLVLLISLVGALVLLRAQSRWWAWCAVALVELTMAVSLLVLATHWLTDVGGGVLLGLTALSLANLPRPDMSGTGARTPGARKAEVPDRTEDPGLTWESRPNAGPPRQ